MQKNTLYCLAGAGMMVFALGVNHAFPRMPLPTLQVIPIAKLATTLGGWQCVTNIPIEAKVHEAITDADFLNRAYRDTKGREAELLLETSVNPEMFHPPTVCMPAQNWNILRDTPTRLPDGTTAEELQMESGGTRLLMLYWYSSERQMDKLQAFKDKLLSGRSPTRMFVRIMVPANGGFETARSVANDLAAAAHPDLLRLEALAAAPASGEK